MKRKYRKILAGLILVTIVLVVATLVIRIFFSGSKDTKVKVLDAVKNYDYVLEERDTALFKETYNHLKANLKNKDIDYAAYASDLAQLFIIDLFTIDNKLSKYDIGGLDYVYPDSQDNYKLNVENTLYKNVEVKDNKRNQDLPVVTSITIDNREDVEYTIGEKTYPAYKETISWEYEKDLGYDNKATVTLIKDQDKVYVVEYQTIEE